MVAPARTLRGSATPLLATLLPLLLLLAACGPRAASAACAVAPACQNELLSGTCALTDAIPYIWLWSNNSYELEGEPG